jgi:spore coat protein U-like protein
MSDNQPFRLLVAGMAVLPLTLLIAAQAARAETATANLGLRANVIKTCNITTQPLSFGDVNVTSGQAVDAAAEVSLACTAGTTVTVTGLGTTGTRNMVDGANSLIYNLYTNSARTVPRVDGGTFTGTGSPLQYTLFARIPSGQSAVSSGSYTDTIVLTLTY